MNYVTGDFDICGTSLQGTINTSYDRLVSLFGEPITRFGDDKVQVEWAVKFDDGTLATIYDSKEDENPSRVTEWHIGGFSKAAVYNVIDEVI